ncbi:MAG: oligopeptide/dipeptide transporter, ATPase subunit [Chloroflexi bacterium]|nr:oligopeptide/dipeptide transporter, ATPase subunit [Chloroflexota bacterium]
MNTPVEQPTSDDAVLRVQHMRTEFVGDQGVVAAVRDVGMTVNRAEKVGIVGESGSGKSALALSILGLIEPPGRIVSGSVWLNGRDIPFRDDREMRRIRGKEISLIFQDPMSSLDPVKNIGDQIIEGIVWHQQGVSRRQARKQAVELLQDVEIPNAERRLHDYPHQYSGGMRQRIMIAIALANEPSVIIADEPTTALDVLTQAQVLDVLQRLVTERQVAVILITHNLGIVAEFCDKVQVMYAGRFVEQSMVDEIFYRPTHPYTEALLESVPRPDRLERGILPSIPGSPPNLARLPAGCSFEPRCSVGHGKQICKEQVPVSLTVGSPMRPVVAECHFARERFEHSAQHVEGAPV